MAYLFGASNILIGPQSSSQRKNSRQSALMVGAPCHGKISENIYNGSFTDVSTVEQNSAVEFIPAPHDVIK